MPLYTPTPNWQPPIPSHPRDACLCNSSPYTDLPPTTVLPKKWVDKTKKKYKNANVSPLNLGNAFAYDNLGGHDVVITGVYCHRRYLCTSGCTSVQIPRPRERNIDEYWWRIYKSRNLKLFESLNFKRRLFKHNLSQKRNIFGESTEKISGSYSI
ncbi:hypothetical protein Tco_1214236 [Tanacetum coccineum]